MGGELADGRWHTRKPGRRIVYLSEHPALCLLEILVHVPSYDLLPDTYQLLSVEVPDSAIHRLPEKELPTNWETDATETQRIGNEWLAKSQLALLVPSVVAPLSRNCLLNPRLEETVSLKPKIIGRFPFDRRLLKG